MTIEIPMGEQGTTRVFSLSIAPAEATQLRDDPPRQLALLGAEGLNLDGIEVFPLSDLGEMGLVGYLRDGVDAQESDLQRDRAKLNALDGWAMLVHSTAFQGRAVSLSPKPELTLIGAYHQTPADKSPIELEAEAAQPYSGTTPASPAKAAPRQRSGSIVVIALAILAVCVLWWALS